MTKKEFEGYINKTVEIVSEYKDAHGFAPSVEVGRLFNRKVVNVTFWNGATQEVRKAFLDGHIKRFDQCGYPVIFDSHRGGGDVQCFTIMWTQSMSPSKVTAQELFDNVMSENTPIDHSKLKYLRETHTDKELLEWAKEEIIIAAPSNTPKRIINDAAEMLVKRLFEI